MKATCEDCFYYHGIMPDSPPGQYITLDACVCLPQKADRVYEDPACMFFKPRNPEVFNVTFHSEAQDFLKTIMNHAGDTEPKQ